MVRSNYCTDHNRGPRTTLTIIQAQPYLRPLLKYWFTSFAVDYRAGQINYNLIREDQAGFRKAYRTVDNIFFLHSIIDKYLIIHKILNVEYVDFKQTFDTISWTILLIISRNNGISKKF